MKINMLVQFMALLDAMRSREEVVAEFERLLRIYEFDFYGVIRQPKPHEDQMSLVLAGRWPKSWPETYIRKKYIVADPTIRYLGHAQSGFRWRDTIAAFRANPQRKRMERMMIDARNHGLEDGYIFPVHGRRGLLGSRTLGGRAGVCEFRAFRQQAVARMDCIGARKLGDANDLVDRQVALDRPEVAGKMRAAPDLVAFVGLEAMERELVLLCPYRDRFQTQSIGRAEDADGNFGTVGDKDLTDRQRSPLGLPRAGGRLRG